jgi:SAM-dependent methyltransferase
VTVIGYQTWYEGTLTPHERFAAAVQRTADDPELRRICDVGGGAKPILAPPEHVPTSGPVREYVLTDISAEELSKAPAGYRTVVADMTRGPAEGLGSFDLIVSRTVAEHVVDPRAFHRTVYEMLAPGGRAMHFFPTLYEPVFIANRLLPEALADRILQRIQSDRARGGSHEKFPAYYRWCRGPTERQQARLEGVGFEVQEYVGVFGHGYYHPLPFLDRANARLSSWLARNPRPELTAYAWVTLRRP